MESVTERRERERGGSERGLTVGSGTGLEGGEEGVKLSLWSVALDFQLLFFCPGTLT